VNSRLWRGAAVRGVVEKNAGLTKADVVNWRATRAAESRAAILGVWSVVVVWAGEIGVEDQCCGELPACIYLSNLHDGAGAGATPSAELCGPNRRPHVFFCGDSKDGKHHRARHAVRNDRSGKAPLQINCYHPSANSSRSGPAASPK